MSAFKKEPTSEEGCKRGSRPLLQLNSLVDSYWLYFTRKGLLNSDGRRLLARIAREAARSGCQRLAERLWGILREPTLEAISALLGEMGYDMENLYVSQYGPKSWRWRSWGKSKK